MPSVRIGLSRSQVDDIDLVSREDSNVLEGVRDALRGKQGPLRPSDLQALIGEQVEAVTATKLRAVLIGLATATRRTGMSVREVLDSVGEFIRDGDARERWEVRKPIFEEILKLEPLVATAKANDLALDFDKLYLRGRIIVDVRPVFDDERTSIVGSTVTHTLRLDYMTYDGDERTISVALDLKDIRELQKESDKALRKTEVTRALMEKSVTTVVIGEDASD